MNVSVVIAKIAGTLSTAKITSAPFTSTRASARGVSQRAVLPVFGSAFRTRKCWPCSSDVMRSFARSHRTEA